MAACAASMARLEPERTAVPMTAWPMPAMVVFTSAKSRLMMPGMVMMSEIPCTPDGGHRRDAETLKEAGILGHGEQLLIGNDDHGVDALNELFEAALGLLEAALALKGKGASDDGDGEDAHFAGQRGNDWGGSSAGASAEASGDEDHVRAF